MKVRPLAIALVLRYMQDSKISIVSPNTSSMPVTACVNDENHLSVGGCDVVALAEKFGTPLWLIDEQTIRCAVEACQAGLSAYPQSQVVYAGKAFLCLAMCFLVKQMKIGLDVVSEGELLTAIRAQVPASSILLHGNNKSASEIEMALGYGPVRIVVDNYSELEMVAALSRKLGRKANLLLRMIPGVEPETHNHIKTGHEQSKFGIPLTQIDLFINYIQRFPREMQLLGLHVHIGSQAHDLEPYFKVIEVLADCLTKIKATFQLELPELDLGGGLGIAYTEADHPIPIYEWSKQISERLSKVFGLRKLNLPKLILEPGRSVIGPAGITLYRVGHVKTLVDGQQLFAVDGGMADNPRPITYQARYTACLANRMNAQKLEKPAAIVGKYCEQGDIIIEESHIAARSRDLVAVLGTGAYNFTMASNYNRTGRPACVLLMDGKADIIVERESNEDLLKKDQVPARLLNSR
jgi:diaminopimelate decarboxylase